MNPKYILLACACVTAALASAQIPNGSFESWTTADPDNWETSNTNSNSNIVSVTKVNTAKAGSNAMKLAAWSYQGFVFGPVAICPKSNSYFVYAGHPTMITGWYMANLQNGDKMMVAGALRKGNSTIGGGTATLTTNTSVYQQFQVPLTYTASQQMSDSATLVVMIQGPNGSPMNLNTSSYIVVDDIQFSTGTATGLNQQTQNLGLIVKQDLDKNSVRIEYTIAQTGMVNISLYDLQGRVVKALLSVEQNPGTYRVDQQLEGLTPGVYLLKLESPSGIATGKVIRAGN